MSCLVSSLLWRPPRKRRSAAGVQPARVLGGRPALKLRLRGRGYLVNEDVERAVWGRAFKAVLPRGARAAECGLLLTEPLLILPALQESTAQARARRGALCERRWRLCVFWHWGTPGMTHGGPHSETG